MTCTVNCECGDYMSSNSYQEIPFVITDSNGNEIDANLYAEAEYRITDPDNCTFDFSASLNAGIVVIGTQFVLITQTTDITFDGDKRHFLRLAENPGELESPVLNRALTILPVCQV